MLYSFQSLQRHNFLTILKKRASALLWPVALIIAVQIFFPQSSLVKDHVHFYVFLITEALQLFSITRDSINEIIVDSGKKTLQINYYNFFQGQMEEKYAMADIIIDISKSRKKEVREIVFFVKNKTVDFTLQKYKDNFNQQDLESLNELFNSIISSKPSA